jgi:predicted aspartyl protease
MAFRTLDVEPLGPLIQVGVRVGAAFAAAGYGGAPHSYIALIDTGASSSAISPQVVNKVRPQLTGTAPVGRAGTNIIVNTHDIAIKFEHHLQPGTWFDMEAVEVAPATPGVDVLIGRDLLKRVTLLYDGLNGKLVLMY